MGSADSALISEKRISKMESFFRSGRNTKHRKIWSTIVVIHGLLHSI